MRSFYPYPDARVYRVFYGGAIHPEDGKGSVLQISDSDKPVANGHVMFETINEGPEKAADIKPADMSFLCMRNENRDNGFVQYACVSCHGKTVDDIITSIQWLHIAGRGVHLYGLNTSNEDGIEFSMEELIKIFNEMSEIDLITINVSEPWGTIRAALVVAEIRKVRRPLVYIYSKYANECSWWKYHMEEEYHYHMKDADNSYSEHMMYPNEWDEQFKEDKNDGSH